MSNLCLTCTADCCKLEVVLDRQEYQRLCERGYADSMTTATDKFLSDHPDMAGRRADLDILHDGVFAVLDKGETGHCTMLDMSTRLCSIYEDRPQICADYQLTRCEKIRRCM